MPNRPILTLMSDLEKEAGAFDLSRQAMALELDEELYRQLLTIFCTQTTKDLAAMESAAVNGSAQAVREAAHSIKGAALNLGLGDFARAALEIEQQATIHAPLPETIDALRDGVREIESKVKALP